MGEMIRSLSNSVMADLVQRPCLDDIDYQLSDLLRIISCLQLTNK